MSIYKLKSKIETTGEMGVWARIAKSGHLDCVLEIDEDYYIKRYINRSMLFYVHIKEGKLVKVCVYEKEKKYGKQHENFNDQD